MNFFRNPWALILLALVALLIIAVVVTVIVVLLRRPRPNHEGDQQSVHQPRQ